MKYILYILTELSVILKKYTINNKLFIFNACIIIFINNIPFTHLMK